jgi:CO/xanthine dehydrogenase Mo-binding subunit
VDTTTALVAILVAVIAAIPAVGALWVSRSNAAAAEAARLAAEAAKEKAAEAAMLAADAQHAIIATKDGVFEIGKRLDGRLQELLKATQEAAEAKGMAAGIAQERQDPQSPRVSEAASRQIGFQAGVEHERHRPGEWQG